MVNLPKPSPEALAHSNALKSHIIAAIDGKSLSFADYMQLCLYAPALGYYVAGATKFGQAGDFVTAPMISPLFAATLAQSIAERSEGTIHVLELGAGTGELARGLLEAFALAGRDCKYAILEVSPDCRGRQNETLHAHLKQVTWLDRLPKHFSGVILANEVLDAMPVHVFRYHQGHLLERRVRWDGSSFVWFDETMDNPLLSSRVEALSIPVAAREEYSSELNLILPAFIRSLIDVLDSGALIFIDYGFVREEYYHPHRSMGTLMCHYRHHAHPDPFVYPGLQDITAHVDFSLIGELAERVGCHVSLYTQAEFLIHHGLLEIMEAQLQSEDDKGALLLSKQVQTLLQPHEMGELFKVMLIEK